MKFKKIDSMNLPLKYVNLILLIAGFGLGQGSLFLANTYLYWSGHYQIIADFGSVNALLTLVVLIGDWGGATYLAKEAVSSESESQADASYASLSAFRVALSLVYLGFLAFVWRGNGGFFTAYLVASAVGVVASALSPVGLLDGRGRSGFSGLIQALPVVAVAVAMPFCTTLDPATAGGILGVTTSALTIVSIAVLMRLARIRPAIAVCGLNLRQIATVVVKATPYMLTPLPGHLLFRGQVYLANVYLPSASIALFIYARQLIGIGFQAAGFYLRVDLKDFYDTIKMGGVTAWIVIRSSSALRISLAISAILTGFAVFSLKAQVELGTVLLAFVPCLLMATASTVLQRFYILTNRPHAPVIANIAGAITAIALMYAVIGPMGVYALILGELVNYSIQVVVLLSATQRNS